MKARQIIIKQHGGPEAMAMAEVDLPAPGPDEVTVRNTAIGLNFIDTYHRGGSYPQSLPSGLGIEAAGMVEAVGAGVGEFAPGDRVCTFGPQLGAYATARTLPAAQLFATPAGVSDETAAAILLKGCTVEFLVERCAKVAAGDWVLVHAAAGGVGLLLVQWLKHIGANVIGTVGSEAKAELARAAGADHVVQYGREDTAAKVRDLTGGAGVRVVFDGVGADTWEASLGSVTRRGLIVSYGNASGAVTGVALGTLAARGSIFVTRPTLFDYYREPEERRLGAGRLWQMLDAGAVSVTIGQRYALSAIAEAHRDLEARRTTGSTLILPD